MSDDAVVLMENRSSSMGQIISFTLVWLMAALPALAKTDGMIPFRNPDLPMDKRVDDLISRLTIEEKISQTMMDSPEIQRLGVHRYHWWNEALHGVARNGVATVFPQAIGLAATWNPELHQEIADVISTEARAKNNETLLQSGGTRKYQGLTIWSPNINIFRDPRWGRGQETYGEDPFLTGQLAIAFVQGLQGNDPNYLKTVATVKHFAVHSGPEPLRHKFDAVVSDRDLRETYLPAFESGIREGGAMSLMSAYNAINGVPGPAHAMLLQDILRDEWGFQGAVVGDVDNVSDMWRPKCHLYSRSPEEASAVAIKVGNDLCSGKTYQALADALRQDLVAESDIDQALRRLFFLRFKLGEFDPAERVPYRSIPIAENDSPAHDELAFKAAGQSLVLLKNDGTLPWDVKTLKTVAILGPTGNEESALLGNYSGTPHRKITLSQGIKTRLESEGVEVLMEPGVPLVKGFRMSGNPFPDGVLFTDEARTRPGLHGVVFAHEKALDRKRPEVEGKKIAARTDTQIDLQWDEAQPIEGIPIENATLRWTGVMIPPKTGEYVMGIVAESAVRLYIGDERVIDSWRGDGERPLSNTIQLEAGKTYKVKLEYAQIRPKGRIQFGWIIPGENDELDRALAAAKQADHVVLTLGLTPDLEGESMSVTAEGFSGGDRTTILLPDTQRELLKRVAALKKPTVMIMTTGSALSFDPDQANAVLLAWYYGQRGADAVAGALLGEVNPAGRLPITFYQSEDDLPPFEDYSMRNRTYRYFTGKPLYAFGHGLSYTTFEYRNLALSTASAKAGDTITVSVNVTNTGRCDGDEVVQIYATALNPRVPMPLRQLVGFQRVSFKAGQVKTVDIEVPVERLRRWDETGNQYVVDAGDYQIEVGPASDRLLLTGHIQVQ